MSKRSLAKKASLKLGPTEPAPNPNLLRRMHPFGSKQRKEWDYEKEIDAIDRAEEHFKARVEDESLSIDIRWAEGSSLNHLSNAAAALGELINQQEKRASKLDPIPPLPHVERYLK